MKTSESMPEIFHDPVAAGTHVRRFRRGDVPKTRPRGIANPARLAAGLLDQMASVPGWREFQTECAALAALAGQPGWEDSNAVQTHPGAKPIGLAQWGAAMSTAGLVSHAAGCPYPSPGIDPTGFIWLNWRAGAGEFSLELHASLLNQSYKWRRIVDGMPREHASPRLEDVVEAVRAFTREATPS